MGSLLLAAALYCRDSIGTCWEINNPPTCGVPYITSNVPCNQLPTHCVINGKCVPWTPVFKPGQNYCVNPCDPEFRILMIPVREEER